METYPYADWLDTFTKKVVADSGRPPSAPPQGCYTVTNFYVNGDGKLVVEYDDNTPAP